MSFLGTFTNKFFRIQEIDDNHIYGEKLVHNIRLPLDLTLPTTPVKSLPPNIKLPIHITEKILTYLFDYYLSIRHLNLSRDLLLFSKSFIKKIYFQHFGKIPADHSIKILNQHLNRTIWLADFIHDNVFSIPTVINYSFYSFQVRLSIKKDRTEPWHLYKTYLPYFSPPDFSTYGVQNYIKYMRTPKRADKTGNCCYVIHTGPCKGDIVWLEGTCDDDGIIRAKREIWPSLILAFWDDDQQFTDKQIKQYIDHSKGWKGLHIILSKMYGPIFALWKIVDNKGDLFHESLYRIREMKI